MLLSGDLAWTEFILGNPYFSLPPLDNRIADNTWAS